MVTNTVMTGIINGSRSVDRKLALDNDACVQILREAAFSAARRFGS